MCNHICPSSAARNTGTYGEQIALFRVPRYVVPVVLPSMPVFGRRAPASQGDQRRSGTAAPADSALSRPRQRPAASPPRPVLVFPLLALPRGAASADRSGLCEHAHRRMQSSPRDLSFRRVPTFRARRPARDPRVDCAARAVACSDRLITCDGPLNICAVQLDTCAGPLNTCEGPFITCEGPLNTCERPLTTCEDPFITCAAPLNGCVVPSSRCHVCRPHQPWWACRGRLRRGRLLAAHGGRPDHRLPDRGRHRCRRARRPLRVSTIVVGHSGAADDLRGLR